MTPQQQRIALAEWANHPFKQQCGNHGCACHHVPDYPKDLNAVHELVSKLSDSQYDGEDGFTATLAFVTQGKDAPELGWEFRPMQEATAAQRCEALLRTLGKWRDE